MRSVVFAAFSVAALAAPASAGPENPEAFTVAAHQLAIAAMCRSKYGETDIFEVAYARFVAIVAEHNMPITQDELEQSRGNLLALEDDGEDNFFARGFCDMLRDEIM